MSINDETFFNENIVKVNKMVCRILFFTIPVPILFAVLSVVDIWIVPHIYSLGVAFIAAVGPPDCATTQFFMFFLLI